MPPAQARVLKCLHVFTWGLRPRLPYAARTSAGSKVPLPACLGVARKAKTAEAAPVFILPWQATLLRYEAFAARKYEAQASDAA